MKKRGFSKLFNGVLIVCFLWVAVGHFSPVKPVLAQDGVEIIINEVDSDTPSTDVLEFVELYDNGVGNTALDGLVVVFYNGNGDLSYAAYDLDGYTTDANGYFLLGNAGVTPAPGIVFASNGLQNGADAVAVYTGNEEDFPSDTPLTTENLIDAVVYGTADPDDAELLALLNAGQPQVDEAGAGDKDNHSSQRCPNGSGGVRNTETFLQYNPTPGAENLCVAPPPPVPDVIINEIDSDTPGTDLLEFVELYDKGVGNTALDGLVAVFFNGSSDTSYAAYDLDGYTTDANGYFLLGNMDVSPTPGIVFGSNGLQNGADAVAVYAGNAEDFPSDTAVTTDNLIDAVVYGTADADDAELLALLNAGQPQVDENGAGDQVNHSSQRCPNGSGGARNTETYLQEVPTPGAENLCELPIPDVIINELDSDTLSTDVLEFVELYDNGVGNTALDGLVVVFFNGSSDTSYAAYDLDSYTTDANGYFLLGNEGVTPTPGIVFGSNGLQNGADAVAVYVGDVVDFPSGTVVTTDNLIDAIVYDTNDADDDGLLVLLNADQPQVDENGAGDQVNHSSQRCPNGAGGARNTETYLQDVPTPGAENLCPAPPPLEECGDPFTPIYTVQGSGPASPLVGTDVSIEGVVTADFQASDQLGGFFVQDPVGDGNAATSDGVYVYGYSVDVSVGDHVRVQGEVKEFYELTEITNTSQILICEPAAAPEPVVVSLPIDSLSLWETYEGMLIKVEQPLYVTGNFTQGRYGEVDLSIEGRLFTPTQVELPGEPALALQDLNDRSRVLLDDASTIQNPTPLPPYLGPNGTLRPGDSTPNVEGVLYYDFSLYRILPTQEVNFTPVNLRPEAPEEVGGSLRVASFNVLNYFNGDGMGGEFPTSRGADTEEEFIRQRDKIIAAITILDADVIGLMEIENDGYGEYSAIQDLVNGLNEVVGAGTYAFVDPGIPQIGTDEIAVGLLYKPARVTMIGGTAILDSSIDPEFLDDENRPPLIQTFEQLDSGERFTVAVNHLKSKGSDCDDIGDPDTGDGQGNCNLTRTAAAEALTQYMATFPTGVADPDFLIIGDLNSYGMEDPIMAIKDAGYSSLIDAYIGTDAYSYQFYGQSGVLDQALAAAHLTEQISGATIWHINADEPEAMSYSGYNQPDLYAPDPYRSSDHDPVLIGLDLKPQLEDFVVLAEERVLMLDACQSAQWGYWGQQCR